MPGVATLTGAQLDSQPGFGEDALRGAQRLPGVVQNGLSASAYVRGGSSNETQVLLDGFPLREAFHLPGYQSFFSLIDPALIDRADIYTGGFPVRYGERMGAVYDLHSLAAQAPHRRALGLSFFNASARSAGDWGGGVPVGLADSRTHRDAAHGDQRRRRRHRPAQLRRPCTRACAGARVRAARCPSMP